MQPTIELLNDEAIYRRTPAGQRALLDRTSALTRNERRFLGIVTGYTPLRVLLDMGWDDPGVAEAILGLYERALISLEPQGGRSGRFSGANGFGERGWPSP